MRGSIVLYSTNTWLAYKVAQVYYGEEHYVWCTPHFDGTATPSVDYAGPRSSCPALIYRDLLEDIRGRDRHSPKIKANKAGILNGAQKKCKAGAIDRKALADITAAVKQAVPEDFFPLIFV